ncbi:pseudaminic acid cytidylyltransferase [Marinilabilia rubra]|uniref:Pseudaminic acid cytidylyltransferase n=1 Tax=Marinilabilia rubra TaxID=2162893 RepID=A0A2U2B3N9_9BACT|nr:pseudaminic acid cytidylyltransferase [Marinilabilia rubra]PWD97681.1 pseudaminic acid cytidylyltransferase [Marinilabilia rubra]
MKNIAIIPARGGSKRIPHKNIKHFLGKPIIAYSIEAAINSDLFDEIMVSTDDYEIAEVAKQHGARVPFLRSEENSDDFATLADVIDEVKRQYLEQGNLFDNICCILPTAPLLTVDNLKKGYDLLSNRNVDSARPVVRFSYPIQRALRLDGNKKIGMFNDEYKDCRSQDLEAAFHDAGQFYWMKFDIGLRGNNKFGFEIPETMVQDIDNEQDWVIAELKYKMINL